MDIREAKEEIRKTVIIYLDRDGSGDYTIPVMKQRPLLLMGAPGIGKTAVVEQVARELKIGFVSYSMTHHTRQSAIGLPYITEREYDNKDVRITEYTMSEIIASVNDAVSSGRCKEGILFLDEINCVSETLFPAMLQFLQYKRFANHALPPGWIIVAAGNPPRYNRFVRDFDVSVLDRLKTIDVEESLTAWKPYARENMIHGAVMSFLELTPECFYSIRTDEGGMRYVTARGWEDLSLAIKLYEKKGFTVDLRLIIQYIKDPEIAGKFEIYYRLYGDCSGKYPMEDILSGKADEGVFQRAGEAHFDERLAVMELIADRLSGDFAEALLSEDRAPSTGERLESAFRFIEKAWGEGEELSFFMTELTAGLNSARFIGRFGSKSYNKYSNKLMFADRKDELMKEIKNG